MEHIAGYIATGLTSLVVGLLLQRSKNRPRLLYWMPGSFIFELKQPQEMALRTDSLTIQNVGREAASDVEILHKTRPDHFQFSTPISYKEETTPSGEHIIRIERVGPGEFVNIQLLSHSAMPFLLSIRSSEGHAKQIAVHLEKVIPAYLQWLKLFVLLVGGGFLLYWLVAAILFLSKSIGAA